MKTVHRAFALFEVIVALSVLSALVGLVVDLLVSTRAQERAADRRVLATLEAANAAEQVTALGWDRTTPDRLEEIRLSQPAQQALPSGELAIAAVPESDKSRRIEIQVRWHGPGGRDEPPVRLNLWVYPTAEEKSP
jgi:type II secretory pathway pseudopilin PulG